MAEVDRQPSIVEGDARDPFQTCQPPTSITAGQEHGGTIPLAEFCTEPFGGLENIKVYVMMTESSSSRLRDLRRIRLSKPVRELQRSSKCDQKPLAP